MAAFRRVITPQVGSSLASSLRPRFFSTAPMVADTIGEEPLFQPFLGGLSRDKEAEEGTRIPQPKDHLLEKYNSPALMSAMERRKLELQRVRQGFQRHDGDCGSSEVQIALFTDKIKYLAEHMKVHRKDYHTRKGLEGMVAHRRKLLKYLRRSDWDAYCRVIARLGLRDRLDSTN